MTMYLEHFGLAEAPFKITPHTEFFFAGANRGETLEALVYAITSGEGMVKVTGEVGAGKTMLCRVLMERLPESVETIYLAVPSLTRDEMLAVIAEDLGVDTHSGNTTKLVRALQQKLIEIHEQGRQVVALIDEAHAMPLATLEEIRLLSNLETSHDKLMQIVLFGQPELDQHLLLPHMRQLKERITHSFTLTPLPANDIKDYVNFRLRAAGYKGPDLFGSEALNLIAEASEGLTRRINIYADKTMLAAFAGGTHTINADHVRAAINDTQIVFPQPRAATNRSRLAIAATLLLGIALGFMAGRFSASPKLSAHSPALARALEPAPGMPSTASAQTDTRSTPVTTAPPPNGLVAPASAAANVTPALAGTPITQKQAEFAPAGVSTSQGVPGAARGIVFSKRLADDATKLQSLNSSAWTIQLMYADARDRSAIENFLRQAARDLGPAASEKLLVFSVGGGTNARVGVVLAPYENRTEASAELARLPGYVAQFKPYARSLQMVTTETRKEANKPASRKNGVTTRLAAGQS